MTDCGNNQSIITPIIDSLPHAQLSTYLSILCESGTPSVLHSINRTSLHCRHADRPRPLPGPPLPLQLLEDGPEVRTDPLALVFPHHYCRLSLRVSFHIRHVKKTLELDKRGESGGWH